MNSQDFRNLQEAYLNVYQEEVLDEKVLGQDPESRKAGSEERKSGNKRLPPSSGKEYAANQKKSISYMDKLTKNNKIIPGMSHESYDQQLDEISIGMKRRAADASVDKVKRAGERFRSSTSVDVQPYLMKKKDEAEAQHLRLAKAAESYEPDLFDVILEYLITEGYADTNENALVIMANMSEDWRQSIFEGPNYDKNRQRAAQRAAARNAARDAGKTGAVPGVGYVSQRREGETYRDAAGVERHTSGARMPKKD